MEFLLADFLVSILGRIGLLLLYRNKTKIHTALNTKYENSYASVGRELISATLLFIFAGFIVLLIFVVLYTAFFK